MKPLPPKKVKNASGPDSSEATKLDLGTTKLSGSGDEGKLLGALGEALKQVDKPAQMPIQKENGPPSLDAVNDAVSDVRNAAKGQAPDDSSND